QDTPLVLPARHTFRRGPARAFPSLAPRALPAGAPANGPIVLPPLRDLDAAWAAGRDAAPPAQRVAAPPRKVSRRAEPAPVPRPAPHPCSPRPLVSARRVPCWADHPGRERCVAAELPW